MTEWHEYGEKRFGEDFVYPVDKERLESPGTFGEDRSGGVCRLEVLGYLLDARENRWLRVGTERVDNNGKGVDGLAIAPHGRRLGSDRA